MCATEVGSGICSTISGCLFRKPASQSGPADPLRKGCFIPFFSAYWKTAVKTRYALDPKTHCPDPLGMELVLVLAY